MTARRFDGRQLVLATHNKGKVREISELLRGHVESFPSAADLNLPEPEETADSYVGNAMLKALAAARASGLPALADDSGVSVAALNGAPGIYSARWAGPEKNFTLAMARVQKELGDATDRAAAFICTLALAWPDGHVETVEGRLDGAIVWPPRGDNGFGYDPIFVPEGETRTFAEMTNAEKQAISHRRQAFAKLVEKVFT